MSHFNLLEDSFVWQRIETFIDKSDKTRIIDREGLAVRGKYLHHLELEGENQFLESWENEDGSVLTITNRFDLFNGKPIELPLVVTQKLLAQNPDINVYRTNMKVLAFLDNGRELDGEMLRVFLDDALSWIQERKKKNGLLVAQN